MSKKVSMSKKVVLGNLHNQGYKSDVISIMGKAKEDLDKRFQEFGGVNHFGKLLEDKGNLRLYEKGALSWSKSEVLYVYGDIYKKWISLGGKNSVVGLPISSEGRTPDGGWFNRFQYGMIYCSGVGTFEIHGDILKKWEELGYERSYLGYPISDESHFPDGGRVSAFQNGAIYWWPDTGAMDLNNVKVLYKGFHCFDETDENSESDEIYVTMGVIDPINGTKTFQTGEYGDVDAGESKSGYIEIYNGKPNGIVINATFVEADHGNRSKYQKKLQSQLQRVHDAGTAALIAIPLVGGAIAAVAGPLITHFMPNITSGIIDFMGLEDDLIGQDNITLTGKDMILRAKNQGHTNWIGLQFKFETRPIRGQDGVYKAYFDIQLS